MTAERTGLAFDEEPVRQDKSCGECGRDYRLIRAFIKRDDVAIAVAFVALHRHGGIAEAWIDAILGTWGDDSVNDHVTFGCRVGPVTGQPEPAASLVDAAGPYADRPIWGSKLTREQALSHPQLSDYWQIVDFLLVGEAEIHAHIYHRG